MKHSARHFSRLMRWASAVSIAAALLGSALVEFAPAQVKPSQSSSATKIRIAVAGPSLSYLPIYIAAQKGFLGRRGLEVEFIQMLPPLGSPALLSREIDYSNMPSAVTISAARGAPLKVISFFAVKIQHTIVTRAEITSVKELAGRKIGVDRFGSIGAFMAQFLIHKHGLGPKTVILPIGRNEQRAQSVLSGIVDATNLPVPLDIKAEEMGMRRLIEMKHVLDVPFSGLGATEEKISGKRTEVIEMLRALAEGLDYVNTNREEVASIVARWMKITPQQAVRALDSVKDTFSDGIPSEEQAKAYLSFLKATGGLKEDVSPKLVFNFSLAEQVAREMNVRKK